MAILPNQAISKQRKILINANQTYQNQGKDTIAQANLDITTNTTNNQGGQLAAGGNLNITTDILNNTQNTAQTQGGLVYAGGKLDLAVATQLTNDQSSIVAGGDIDINGTELNIDNKSGTIQSDSNINITAKNLNNTAYHYDTKEDDSDAYYGYDVNDKVSKSDYVMDDTVVIEQDEPVATLGSKQSFITALKDIVINLSDELFNSSSVINAKEDLTITTNKVTNETNSISTHEMNRKWGKNWIQGHSRCSGWGPFKKCRSWTTNEKTSWEDTRSELVYSKNKGTLAAGQNLTINANESITNGEVVESNEFLEQTQTDYKNNNAIQDALASNGQFKINKPSSNQPHAIETRGEFIDLNKFKASQYLFARPHIGFLDPSAPNPAVMGDAHWEHEKLKRQIIRQTKKAELYAGYDTNAAFERLFNQSNEEFEKLSDKGIEINFGVALSKAAIKALTQDIVWYENEEVVITGEKHIALVPRLYLAEATIDDLEKTPQAFLAAQNITLNSDGTIANRGDIAADNNTSITAGNITNQGGTIKGGNVDLTVQQTIINQSGDIKAGNDLNLTARTIANIASERTDRQKRDSINTVGNGSNLEGKNVNINAQDVINTASNITAEGLDIKANNVSIGTQQNITDLKVGGGSNYSNSQSVKNQGSNINVAGDLSINADKVNIQGTKVVANNASISSNSLNIVAAQDSKSNQIKSSASGGLFGASSKISINSQKITNQGSELDIANQLTIENKQIQIIASKVKAKTLEVQTQLLKLISQKDPDFKQEQSDSSGFLTRTITDKGHNKETKVAASIQANDKLTVNNQELTQLSTSPVSNQLTNTQRETPKQLSSTDSLKIDVDKALKQQLKDKNINLADVKLNNKDWDESTTTLSGLGAVIVQVAAMYFTGGFDALGSAAQATTGAATSAAASAATQLTAQQAFTQAAITSVQSQMVSALATSAITGNSLDIDPEQMLKTALAAGASQFAMKSLGVQTKYDKTKSFDTNLVGGIQRAGVNSAVNTAIQGGSLKDNLKDNLGSEALSVASAKLANEIGANQEDLGEVGHKAAHAALGCAGAKASGGDCESGAVGAVLGEIIAEQVGKNQNLDDKDVTAISRIGTAAITQGLGKDVEVADKAAKNALENNYLSHRENTQKTNLQKQIGECKKQGNCDTQQLQTLQQELSALIELDKDRDAKIASACDNNPSSQQCQNLIQDFKDKQATYDTAEKRKGYDNLLNPNEYKNNHKNLVNTRHVQQIQKPLV